MKGQLVESISGHDIGKIYVVIEEKNSRVLLADGVLRPIEKAKPKNRKHVKVIASPIAVETIDAWLARPGWGNNMLRETLSNTLIR